MDTTTREIVHVRRLLADFDIFLTTLTPLTCDNQSSIKIATNSGFHERRSTLRLTATSVINISLQALSLSHIH